jgi:hypothetical protein
MQLCPLRGSPRAKKIRLDEYASGSFIMLFFSRPWSWTQTIYANMFPMGAKGRIDLRRDLDFTDFAKLNCVETRMRQECEVRREMQKFQTCSSLPSSSLRTDCSGKSRRSHHPRVALASVSAMSVIAYYSQTDPTKACFFPLLLLLDQYDK